MQRLLDLARLHLGMELAWVSHFTEGQQVIDHLSGDGAAMHVHPGQRLPALNSFCVRVLSGAMAPVVPDARRHLVSRELEVTAQLSIGSYAAAPLRDRGGKVIGMLCCLSRSPDPRLDEHASRFLSLMAELIGDQLASPAAIEQRALELQRQQVRSLLQSGGVRMVFQPVVRLSDGVVLAYEALARFTDPGFPSPDLAFAAAARVGLGVQLELMTARQALRRLPDLPAGVRLGVNLSAEAVVDAAVQDLLLRHAARARRTGRTVVVEITEHTPVADYELLLAATGRLRAGGVQLAVDDAGAGYASLRHILQLRPDSIKVDISLVRDIDTDPVRQALTRSLVAFAGEVGARLIAEGVEHRGEAEVLRSLGVQNAQGYLYGRPAPLPHHAPVASQEAGVGAGQPLDPRRLPSGYFDEEGSGRRMPS